MLVGTLTLPPSPSPYPSLYPSVSFCCVPATFKGKAKQWGPKTSTDNRAAASDFSCFFTIFLLFFFLQLENCATHQKASGRTGISLAFMHRKLAQNLMLTKVTIVVSLASASASAATAASLWGLSSPKLVEPNWSELRRHFWQTDKQTARQTDWHYLGYSIWRWYLATNWT